MNLNWNKWHRLNSMSLLICYYYIKRFRLRCWVNAAIYNLYVEMQLKFMESSQRTHNISKYKRSHPFSFFWWYMFTTHFNLFMEIRSIHNTLLIQSIHILIWVKSKQQMLTDRIEYIEPIQIVFIINVAKSHMLLQHYAWYCHFFFFIYNRLQIELMKINYVLNVLSLFSDFRG